MYITTGAPNTAVIVLTDISVGEKSILLRKSHKRQKLPPARKQAGIIIIGLAVLKRLLARCGTAIPTKEIGPAKAVTQADNTLDKSTSSSQNALMLTPIFAA